MGMVWGLESGSDDVKASLYDFKAVQLCRNGFPSLYLSFLIHSTKMERSFISRTMVMTK